MNKIFKYGIPALAVAGAIGLGINQYSSKAPISENIMKNRAEIVQMNGKEILELRGREGPEGLGKILGFKPDYCQATDNEQRNLDNLILHYNLYKKYAIENGLDLHGLMALGSEVSNESFCATESGAIGIGGLTSQTYAQQNINPFIPRENIKAMAEKFSELFYELGGNSSIMAYKIGYAEQKKFDSMIEESKDNNSIFRSSTDPIISTYEGIEFLIGFNEKADWIQSRPELKDNEEGEELRRERIDELESSGKIYELPNRIGGMSRYVY